jgi:3-hydroxybutyrate dehydrogenase
MLKAKNAVITGSTSGIGLGLAQALAAEGVNIVLNGFGDPDKIEEFRRELEKTHGIQALYSAADMTNGLQIEAMIGEVQQKLGSLDILVNNAGIQYVAPIEEFPPEKWNAIIAINLSSAYHTIHAALPLMKRHGFGRIVNIASAHGLVASPFKSAYVAAKHGILGLTKTVALEVAELNITCNAICPGYVLTPLVEGQIDEQAKVHNMTRAQVIKDVILAAQPNKRFVEIEELGALTVFLCGEHGGSINGAALPMDGGWTAR